MVLSEVSCAAMDHVTVQRVSENETLLSAAIAQHSLSTAMVSKSPLLLGLIDDLRMGASVCVQAPQGYVDAWASFRNSDSLSCSGADDASLLTLINVRTV